MGSGQILVDMASIFVHDLVKFAGQFFNVKGFLDKAVAAPIDDFRRYAVQAVAPGQNHPDIIIDSFQLIEEFAPPWSA